MLPRTQHYRFALVLASIVAALMVRSLRAVEAATADQEPPSRQASDRIHAPAQPVFVVNSTHDATDAEPADGICAAPGGSCTLRAAIREANNRVNAIVRLPPGTYRLTIVGADEDHSDTGDLDIHADVTLVGLGGRDITAIRAENGDRVLDFHGGSESVVEGVTLSGGSGVELGGGVLNRGRLTLRNARVISNTAEIPASLGQVTGYGGGISSLGTLVLKRSEVAYNRAANDGGGISDSGNVVILDSELTGNVSGGNGGAIAHDSWQPRAGYLRVERSRIRANRASGSGGALHVGGTLSTATLIVDTEFSDNRASQRGGAVSAGSERFTAVHVVGGRLTGNSADSHGGAIAFGALGVVSATLDSVLLGSNSSVVAAGALDITGIGCTTVTLANSLVADNTSDSGGGIYAGGRELGSTGVIRAKLINTTVTGNVASREAGAIAVDVRPDSTLERSTLVTLDNVTLAGNRAPAGSSLFANDSGANVRTIVSMLNSIIEGSPSSAHCALAGGAQLLSRGYNVGEDASCALTTPGDQPSTDPELAALLDNGGATHTHGLLPSSPAIDVASAIGCPAVDQRGAVRPAGAACDVGAFEFGGEPPTSGPDMSDLPLPYVPPWTTYTGVKCEWPYVPPTPTPTASPTLQILPKPTPTPTAWPTLLPIPSPTPSPTNSPSPSPTNSPSPTTPSSMTPTSSPSPTVSTALTPTSSPTPSSSRTPAGSPTTTTQPTPSSSAMPTPTSPLPIHVCPQIRRLAPSAAIHHALADPGDVIGFDKLVDPGKPEGPFNPRRRNLTLHNFSVPYHTLFNPLEFRAWCP